MVHLAPDTTSDYIKIGFRSGRGVYRGLVRVEDGSETAKSFVRCDALILDDESRSYTYPYGNRRSISSHRSRGNSLKSRRRSTVLSYEQRSF